MDTKTKKRKVSRPKKRPAPKTEKPKTAGTGSAKPTGGSGGGKTADILINYYNGASGVTTVEQKSSGGDKKNSDPSDNTVNQTPAAPGNDNRQEDLDKPIKPGETAAKDAAKNTSKAKEGA